eukprot:GHVS01037057.1.p1 GENE.GHVS01037057.1~~GHVS01037057.1.p1  ORF type:complete len:607 (+),score=116.47 GHVS01037057.1:219-2039(+)
MAPVKAAVPSTPIKRKRLVKTEENFEPINRWWEKEDHDTNEQWHYMEHYGLMFFPPYVPHGVKMKYMGKAVDLPGESEEISNFWCGVLESDYSKKKVFVDNFWTAFQNSLPAGHIVKDARLVDCDFTLIKEHLDAEKQRKKDMTKLEKEEAKRQKTESEAMYAHAIVDWIREKVGCSKVEPAGLFRGRGEHPKQGMLKKRIVPEDVTLNMAEQSPVPRVSADMPGHCWSDVNHDNTITWMAYFKDTINDQFKYMYLAAQSKFKGLNDFLKYEKARKLKDYVDRIRQDYSQKMKSRDMVERQLGTATYLIDFLALRVGGEKDTDEEADTVGCCSLRLEHLQLNAASNEITLDFLGKDSIRYLNTVQIDEQAFKNMQAFTAGKKTEADVFDKISSGSLNSYLRELMPGLSAKVFRTYNASITLQNELKKLFEEVDQANPNEILQFYNNANREVAILCNHQRSVPKQHEASMDKMQKQLALVDEDIREMDAYLHFLKSKAKNKKFIFDSDVKDIEGNPRKVAVKTEQKEDVVKSKLRRTQDRRNAMDLRIRTKDDNKTVALGTSKINYMDPRITVAYCKKYEMPIEKVFNKSLRLKFPWAMFVKSDFEF